ncbi:MULTISPECIES: sensor histidine kinase [unclassified Shewanella]|uniref:sensor histidine kinase n=1 Tax=unclassified Shewanella TaxID=196818 RepID=UPI000C834321|nr:MULTISPECIES: HAMP domain-containing sensor histidine kinase [unclassified Shewanella]PMG30389.1 two-component sensor histidine kinase [Shewanella sp. 10N.286.52.C2]PMH87986.1 two-component sensor histidine kinase [Shewanella sp. 10N.286.48.B5]
MNRLFNRLFLSATLMVLLLFVALWQWLQLNHEFSRNQIQQSLHLQLAEHMAHINPLLSQGITSDAALKEAFHDFMLLGPSFEIYTLDPQGRVIAYDAKEEKIKTTRVNLAKIKQFIAGRDLPILGTDPRSKKTEKIFSVSPLITTDGLHSGYLYVIIGGEDYDSWQALINSENQPKLWGATIGFWIIFALMLFVLLLGFFTQPIKKLASDLNQLKDSPLSGTLALPNRYNGSEEIRVLSDNINHLLHKISQQHQQVKRQQQAKHDFLLHLSHDLKTPLTSLLGYIDTWLLLPPAERQPELIEYAANSGQNLQQLLAQLLELAALENGQISAQISQINLREVLLDLKQTFAPRAQKLGILLDFNIADELQVYTDPQLMRRILNNLVDNALRYTPKGGTIKVYSESLNGQSWLAVKDTGAGMHKHEVEALKQLSMQQLSFEPNQTLPQLGVGLAIVRQLLGLLKCRINVDSEPGTGSCFHIELQSCHH